MSKIAVVYWSGTGNTEAMANAVLEGAKAAGADAALFTADAFDASQVDAFDAIAFGCPSMGVEELEDGEFEPMFSACEGALNGKKIALFGSYGWGDGEWMRNWKRGVRKSARYSPPKASSATTRRTTKRRPTAKNWAPPWRKRPDERNPQAANKACGFFMI